MIVAQKKVNTHMPLNSLATGLIIDSDSWAWVYTIVVLEPFGLEVPSCLFYRYIRVTPANSVNNSPKLREMIAQHLGTKTLKVQVLYRLFRSRYAGMHKAYNIDIGAEVPTALANLL